MSDEVVQTIEAETKTEDAAQTVTAEQFAELQRKLEATVSAQSGSDKRVRELTKALNEARAEKEAVVKTETERLAELEKKWQAAEQDASHQRLKAFARGLLDEASIKPPRYFDRLIGDDEEETKKWVLDFVEDEKARTADRNKEFDRANGRTVSGPEKDVASTWDNLQNMSEDQLGQMDPKEIVRITREARKA